MSHAPLIENDESSRNTGLALQPDFVLSAYWDVLSRMAEAWLAAGWRVFGIWRAGQLLARWPLAAPAETAYPDLTAQVRVDEGVWGELGVIGVDCETGFADPAVQARLSSDAEALSTLLQRELDLVVMTDELSESQDQMLALSELAQSMRSMLDVGEIIHALTYQAMRLTKACATFTWFADPAGAPIHQDQPAPFLDDRQAQVLFDQVRWNNRPLLFDRASSPALLPPEVENLYVIPIQFGGMTIAALGILFNRPAAALSPDLKLGRAIARQAEVYFENCLLHQEAIQQTQLRTELELARNLQFRLLPQNIPLTPGLDIYAVMRPAKEVGGDFYGINLRQDGSIILSVGDAAGKGMPAALLMSMSHTVISSAARHVPALTPQVLIARAVQDLYNDFTETGLFVTLFVCQYRPEGMVADGLHPPDHSPLLIYANAGHSPVIFRPAQGSARLLEADAPPMGVLPESLSVDHYLPFGPGDVMVIATDGFSEASNQAGEMYAYDNLLKMVDDTAARSAAEIAAQFFRAIDEFAAGIPQQDDQTLVVIKGIPT